MHQTAASLCLAMMVLGPPAHAGEYFETNGVAIGGYDPVRYLTDRRAVAGMPAYAFSYRGSTFHFASAADRDLFAADPARYAPQYNGFCTFGVAQGAKVASNPSSFRVVGGKLYLQYNDAVSLQFDRDVSGNLRKADINWPGVQSRPIER
jgi:YHS domain-containing protein